MFWNGGKFRTFPHCDCVMHTVHTMRYTVWKLQKFTLTLFWQKIRESNAFTKWITKELIWRKKILVRVSFSFFHSVLPLWKLRNFTSTVFSLKFCQINVLQKLYYKLVWRKKNWLGSEFRFTTLHSVEITEIISHFFGRNFVKATFSLEKLLQSWFHEIFFRWESISRFCTLCSVHCEAEI